MLILSWVPRSQAYVALKIHAANVDVSGELSIQKYLTANYSTDPNSRFVHLLLDSFVLEGPNGKHTCFVTEPTGPSVSVFLTAPSGSDDPFASRRFPTSRTKSFLKDILAGLQFLHGNNVVHGDLQSGNLLFSLRNLNSLDRGGLEQDETNSKLDPLIRIDGKTDLWAPRYLVAPKPLADEALPQEQQTVQLADLGGGMHPRRPRRFYYHCGSVKS